MVASGPGSSGHEWRDFPHQHENARAARSAAIALQQLFPKFRVKMGAAPIQRLVPWDGFPIHVEPAELRIREVEILNRGSAELCPPQIGSDHGPPSTCLRHGPPPPSPRR